MSGLAPDPSGPDKGQTTEALRVEELRLHYRVGHGVVRAVDGVSFSLEQGEALGIVGESGAGKSSLSLALLRLLPRNVAHLSGRVVLRGVDCLSMDEASFRRRIRWREAAMVFQGAMESLNPVLKVGDQIAEPLRAAKVEKAEAKRRVEELLELVHLPPSLYGRYPHELSGGMKQRVAIAMALALKPPLVILDEPTSALDVSVQAQVMNLLKRLKRELGLSIIFITHDIALACDICDRLAVMYAGELIEQGGIDEVISTPAHPYTQRLLASVARLDTDAVPESIPGAPPDLSAPPSGCRFHPRCSAAFEPCSGLSPPIFPVGAKIPARGARDQHHARCWLLREPE